MSYVGEDSPFSEYIRSRAEEIREDARGWGYMRNMTAIGVTAFTGALNATESVRSWSTVEQIKFNAAGVAIAAVSALGMEYGRRRELRRAQTYEAHAEELASLDL